MQVIKFSCKLKVKCPEPALHIAETVGINKNKMKILTLKLGLIIFIISLISCNENKKNNYIYFSAQIENPNSDTLFISEFYGDTALVTFNLKERKIIRDSMILPMAFYRIGDGNETTICFLKPGFDLNFSLNTKEFDESVSYTGKGSAENNYLAEKYLLEENFGELTYYGYYGKLSEDSFINLTDSLYDLELRLFNKEKNKFDKDFEFIEYKNIQTDYLLKFTDFEGIHRFVTGDKEFKVSDKFPNPYDSLNVNDDKLLILPNYINFINSYIQNLSIILLNDNDTLDYHNIFINIVDTLIKNKNIRQEVAYHFGKYEFSKIKEPEYCYKKLKTIISKNEYLKPIEETYAKINKIKKGEISPTFELYDLDSNLVKLQDFKGKVVYVDIWAIWCLPCRKEIPHLEKLESHYKDSNIVFISICKDDTRSRWKKTVRSNELSGVHLFAPENNIDFFKDYLVDGVPRYILIDKDGRIIDSDAIRPSDIKIEKTLNNLLN